MHSRKRTASNRAQQGFSMLSTPRPLSASLLLYNGLQDFLVAHQHVRAEQGMSPTKPHRLRRQLYPQLHYAMLSAHAPGAEKAGSRCRKGSTRSPPRKTPQQKSSLRSLWQGQYPSLRRMLLLLLLLLLHETAGHQLQFSSCTQHTRMFACMPGDSDNWNERRHLRIRLSV